MIAAINGVIQGLASLFKWLALKAELEVKRYAYDLQEEITEKNREDSAEINRLRGLGDHVSATQLQDDRARRCLFQKLLPTEVSDYPTGEED